MPNFYKVLAKQSIKEVAGPSAIKKRIAVKEKMLVRFLFPSIKMTKKKDPSETSYYVAKFVISFAKMAITDILILAARSVWIDIQRNIRSKLTFKQFEELMSKLNEHEFDANALEDDDLVGDLFTPSGERKTYPKFSELMPKFFSQEMTADEIISSVAPSERENAQLTLASIVKLQESAN